LEIIYIFSFFDCEYINNFNVLSEFMKTLLYWFILWLYCW